jgi:hypothetical protein
MKTPRVRDFDPDAKVPILKSSMENMPTIEKSLQNNQNASLLPNQQANKLANQQTNTLVNQQTSKTPLSTKDKKKYGTYLREDSILNIQVTAAQGHKKDHELLQEIVDLYFENSKK